MTTRRSLSPNAERQARGLHGMALGWLKRGRVKQAIISLNKAMLADPSYLDPYLELGRILLHLRRWTDLVEVCRRGLQYFIEVPELHKLMITALEEHGSLDDAYACYELVRRDRHHLNVGADEILCCVAVRNERARMPYFLDYYRQLGVDRFFFIDNGSSDGTTEWLLARTDVHLWTSNLSFKRANFGSAWFEILLRDHGIGHWCLTVDADEFSYFDGAPERSLKQFCRDLDRRGKQAVTGVLLDMYSDRPVRETVYNDGDDPLALCPFFDRAFFHTRFEQGGQYRNQTIFFGGVRQRVFPAEHDFLLSKVVLLRYQPDVVLTSGQHLTNIPEPHLAQQQICLLHYKFFASVIDYARSEAEREIHAMAGEQYKAYDRELSRQQDLVLFNPAESVRFEGMEQLRELGVLLVEEQSPTPRIPPIGVVTCRQEERPFWSVMITVHDRVQNLERVLGSVLAQADDNMRIEVICDGGDPERQRAVGAEVERVGGNRVLFHPVENRIGHPHIFNRCIERATGHWVHILHDDDWLEPGFYTALRTVIETAPGAGAAFCQHRIVDQSKAEPVIWDSRVERETPGIIDDWLARIALECRVQFSAMTVRRSTYESLGGFSPDALSALDWEMWTRIAVHHPVGYVPEILVNIGRDDSAESSRLLRSGEQVHDALEAIEVATPRLPPTQADVLSSKARDRITAYALDVARQYLERGDTAAALNNLRAAVAGRPSARTLRQLVEVLQGVNHDYRG